MNRNIFLTLIFSLTAILFYFVSPSSACGVKSICNVVCYNASGQEVGAQSCTDQTTFYSGSCECYTDYDNSGFAYCHSHCSSTTGQDTYCAE
jgi:hypothetical protein